MLENNVEVAERAEEALGKKIMILEWENEDSWICAVNIIKLLVLIMQKVTCYARFVLKGFDKNFRKQTVNT